MGRGGEPNRSKGEGEPTWFNFDFRVPNLARLFLYCAEARASCIVEFDRILPPAVGAMAGDAKQKMNQDFLKRSE